MYFIAHRGLAYYDIENTREAFLNAKKKGFKYVEGDIRFTKDRQIVVFHDEDLNRLAGINKKIRSIKKDELMKICLGKNRKILGFEEWLFIIKKESFIPFIEIKERLNKKTLYMIINQIKDMIGNDFFVISFHASNLKKIRSIDKDISLGFLVSRFKDRVLHVLKKYNLEINIFYQELNEDIAKRVHQLNKLVITYTVDDIKVANRMKEMNVDFLTTNKIYEPLD